MKATDWTDTLVTELLQPILKESRKCGLQENSTEQENHIEREVIALARSILTVVDLHQTEIAEDWDRRKHGLR